VIAMTDDNEKPVEDNTDTKTTVAESSEVKPKSKRYANDKEFLTKLITELKKGPIKKEDLAKELKLEGVNNLSDKVILAAIRLAGNSNFLNNLIENKKTGKDRLNPKYSKDTGLLITKWHFEKRDIMNGQRYKVVFNDKTKIITLSPTDKEKADDNDK
jgi:hypothetical protein